MPPLLANFIHARGCKPKCEKSLTLPVLFMVHGWSYIELMCRLQNLGICFADLMKL